MSRKIIIILFALFSASIYAASFSGMVGVRGDFFGDPIYSDFDGNLVLKTYFAGSLAIVPNLFLRAEVSVATSDIIDESFFNEVPATFQLDELSLTYRAYSGAVTNYLSFYVGNYEGEGSDNFLTRYLGMARLSSRLCDNFLGLNGATINPKRTVGGSDIMRFTAAPVALGIYCDVNHYLDSSYTFNGALRLAMAFRYFSMDFLAGVGMPLTDASDDLSYASLDRFYIKAAATMMIGNDVSGGLFIQGGLCDVPIIKDSDFTIDEDHVYFIFEPRFRGKAANANLSIFYVPDVVLSTINDPVSFLYRNKTSGVALDIFSNVVTIGSGHYTFGGIVSASVPKYFSQYDDFYYSDLALKDCKLLIAPYFDAHFFKGTLRFMVSVDAAQCNSTDAPHCFSITLGYKSKI